MTSKYKGESIQNSIHNPREYMEQLSQEIADHQPIRIKRFNNLAQLIDLTQQALNNLIPTLYNGTKISVMKKLINELINAGIKMEENLEKIYPLEGITRDLEYKIISIRSNSKSALRRAQSIINRQNHFGGQTISRITGNRLAPYYERITGRGDYPYYYTPETPQEHAARLRHIQEVRQQREQVLAQLDALERERWEHEKKNKKYEQAYQQRLYKRTNKKPIKNRR